MKVPWLSAHHVPLSHPAFRFPRESNKGALLLLKKKRGTGAISYAPAPVPLARRPSAATTAPAEGGEAPDTPGDAQGPRMRALSSLLEREGGLKKRVGSDARARRRIACRIGLIVWAE